MESSFSKTFAAQIMQNSCKSHLFIQNNTKNLAQERNKSSQPLILINIKRQKQYHCIFFDILNAQRKNIKLIQNG